MEVASLILAAGRGTRMVGYGGCKALLPLVPSKDSIYEGERPFIIEIMKQLPEGPKAVVIHHEGDKVMNLINQNFPPKERPVFIRQPELNGTGGAVLASKSFLESVSPELCIITMVDVPLISSNTYRKLLDRLIENRASGVVLAFRPGDRSQYGCLMTEGEQVKAIIEWKYWKDFSEEIKENLKLCNAGVYTFRRDVLIETIPKLAERPHTVKKIINNNIVTFEEFFLTDIVALMAQQKLNITFIETDENEVIGVDTPDQLRRVQDLYKNRPPLTL